MKRLCTILALVAGLVAPLEAAVEYRARTWQEGSRNGRQAESSVKAALDGGKVKILFEDSGNQSMPAGSYLLSTDAGETVYLVRPEDKIFGKFDLDAAMALLGAFTESGMLDIQIENPKLEKLTTGPGKTVAGVSAKHARYGLTYEMEVKIIGIRKRQTVETIQDIWYTDEVKGAGRGVYLRRDLPKTGTDLDELIALEASKISGFPLEVVDTTITTGKKGKQTKIITHTLVSDLRQGVSFPADTWVIPSDYEEVQLMPTGEMLAGGEQQPPPGEEDEEEKGGILGRFKKFGKKKDG